MPERIDSQLLNQLDGWVETAPNTDVQILEEAPFIYRYAGVLGLRNAVQRRTGVTMTPWQTVRLLSVYPHTNTGLRTAHERFESAMATLDSTYTPKLYTVPELQPPMTEIEVVHLAESILSAQTKVAGLERVTGFNALKESVRLIFGKESLIPSAREAQLAADVPDVIAFYGEENLQAVLIRGTSEAQAQQTIA